MEAKYRDEVVEGADHYTTGEYNEVLFMQVITGGLPHEHTFNLLNKLP